MTTRTQQRRLARAGYTAVTVAGRTGYVRAAFAARVAKQIDFHTEEVEKILAEPTKPKGRPPARPKITT